MAATVQRREKPVKTYLEPDEINQLAEAALCQRDKLLILTTFHLGCRVSESLGMEPANIDFGQGRVTIQHLKTRLNIACIKCGTRLGKSSIFCPKCGVKVEEVVAKAQEQRKMRAIPLDNETLVMLKDFIDLGGPVKRGDKLLLFPINRHRAWQIITECAEKAGLPKLVNPETGKIHNVSPHKLRDAFAVNAVKHNDSGDGLRLLQEHLGHANFNTTAKYRKVSGEEQRDWYQKLWEDGK
jgi:integrase/recombinase XerD